MSPKLNREKLAQVEGPQGPYCPFLTALPHSGEVNATSSLQKLRAWEAGRTNAPVPEGVITVACSASA